LRDATIEQEQAAGTVSGSEAAVANHHGCCGTDVLLRPQNTSALRKAAARAKSLLRVAAERMTNATAPL